MDTELILAVWQTSQERWQMTVKVIHSLAIRRFVSTVLSGLHHIPILFVSSIKTRAEEKAI